ncbi:MAG TPA: hypothetical protein VNF99_02350, partial [Stellaceae bacterium]|nr:hypothetical protein [Stellaceae bacterium]
MPFAQTDDLRPVVLGLVAAVARQAVVGFFRLALVRVAGSEVARVQLGRPRFERAGKRQELVPDRRGTLSRHRPDFRRIAEQKMRLVLGAKHDVEPAVVFPSST